MPTATPSRAAVLAALPLAAISLQHRKRQEQTQPSWVPSPHQVPPPGDWLYFVLLAGRGAGKTIAGAHYVNDYAMAHPGARIGILAPTTGDARSVCVEGETGLLGVNPRIVLNRSWGELKWPNGSKGQLFGAYQPDDVERLRGPQHHLIWWDELAASRQLGPAWDMMRLGLRLGDRPHAIITTTPRPRKRLAAILADPRTVVATAHTDDNPHLHADVRAELYRLYGGTRLGRQELAAEMLTDTPGALWTAERLEANRVQTAPDLLRVVVAVDPSGGGGEGHDEVGIVAAGLGGDGHGYVLGDYSDRLSPEAWARRAVNVYHQLQADRIVAEANFGGEMVRHTIQTIDPTVPIKLVTASRGKQLRAEPISSLDEQGRVHLVGALPLLEDQCCSWVPASGDPSPDRMDAMVWALTELMVDTHEVAFY